MLLLGQNFGGELREDLVAQVAVAPDALHRDVVLVEPQSPRLQPHAVGAERVGCKIEKQKCHDAF